VESLLLGNKAERERKFGNDFPKRPENIRTYNSQE
jgi:hypothetical protein